MGSGGSQAFNHYLGCGHQVVREKVFTEIDFLNRLVLVKRFSSLAEKFSVFETFGRRSFSPAPKTSGLYGLSHELDDMTLTESSNFSNFLKSNTVCPSSPDNPIGTFFRWFWVFDTSNWETGFF